MNKKLLVLLLLVLALFVCLAACKGDDAANVATGTGTAAPSGDPVDPTTEPDATTEPGETTEPDATTEPGTTEPTSTEPTTTNPGGTTEPASTEPLLTAAPPTSAETTEPTFSVEPEIPNIPTDTPSADASVYDVAAGPDTSWYTADKTEYTLTSANQLVGFHALRSDTQTFDGITIKLACDVILNEGTVEEILARANDADEATTVVSWAQLNSAWQFKGTFDGQGHIISGLYLQTTTNAVRGMFGGVGDNAVIKNFTLTNAYYGAPNSTDVNDKGVILGAGKHSIGAIAAKIHAGSNVTISDVTVSARMLETANKFTRMGGFIGTVETDDKVADNTTNITLNNCTFNGVINITGNYAGGMIAYVNNPKATITLTNCTNNANIYAREYAGGLVGLMLNLDKTTTFTNCTNTSSVTSLKYAGGLVGSLNSHTLAETNCTSSGTITADYARGDLYGFKTVYDNGARPTTIPEGKSALRVMSFNIQGTLSKSGNVYTDAAQNRIKAVKTEIRAYAPDLLGLQEDNTAWISLLDAELTDYNHIVDTSLGGSEMCAIYYKKGMKLLASGSKWITNSGINSGVALTVKDITTDGSKYRISDEDLAVYGITKDSPDSILTAKFSYTKSDGKTGTYTILGPRKMTWGVFDINGQAVIYVNTHLQHRSQTAEYSTQAYQNIRSMERIKSFDLLQAQLKEIKKSYPNAVDFLTGDFNDLVGTAIYNAATIDYGYASSHVAAAERYGVDGSWNNPFNLDKQGANYPNKNEGTNGSYLDYCFVSKGIDVLKFRVGAGKATFTGVDGNTTTVYSSDHLPIITDLCFATSKTGSVVDPDYKEEEEDLTQPSVYTGIADASWYTGTQTEYTITTADQLMGLLQLRETSKGSITFEGVTIKLGRDLVFNQGTVDEILARKESGGTVHSWKEINSAYLFKGIFDGQGHTISGVYLQTQESLSRGMFGGVGGNAVIKNFTLNNSYFGAPITGNNKGNFGCIVAKIADSSANVTLSGITVQNTLMKELDKTIKNAGGLVGLHEAGSLTIDNCAFNGTITLAGSTNVGGLVGGQSGGTVTIYDNCSVGGTITCNNTKGTYIGNKPDYVPVKTPVA